MNNPKPSYQIIPAQPGFSLVYDLGPEERTVELGEPVIAWRVETSATKDDPCDFSSVCIPITVDGDMDPSCAGVQNPDKTVTVFFSGTYSSIAELQAERYPKV
ncbi:hypothetical protein ZRA01_31280 [Zoogloea ramigera]|uniref:Uncharacterized protein n=1 Tax=Zoogloea ramigera TaxID=350 RepID=A0A4Y4CVS7_ZOORA|nr:hypothetical protein [Zoogloea ramigera]GEC97055.1 hypothetical protein ZRA01_31280 [Zoogloea ramigera]